MYAVVIDLLLICYIKDVLSQKDLTSAGRASQSSNYYHRIGNWGHNHEAHVAKTGTSHVWVDTYTYTCSATGPDRSTAWWMLSFPDMYFFTKVDIYYRQYSAYRLAGFSVYITNSTTISVPPTGYLCYRHKGPELPDIYQDISCHYLGKNVLIYNNRTEDLENYHKISKTAMLELCGVKVFGCKRGFHGKHCNQTCRENCLGDHCFPENNTCVWGCNWKQCKSELCGNKAYGTCRDGCVSGVTGDFCQNEVPSTSTTGVSAIVSTTKRPLQPTQGVATGFISNKDDSEFNYNILIIAVFATVVIVILAVVLLCLIQRRRQQHIPTSRHRMSSIPSIEDHTQGDQTLSNSNHDVRGAQEATRNVDQSLNGAYDRINESTQSISTITPFVDLQPQNRKAYLSRITHTNHPYDRLCNLSYMDPSVPRRKSDKTKKSGRDQDETATKQF